MENTEKMTQEAAQAEFERWAYETKKLRPVALKKHADAVDNFVDALCDGTLVIENDGSITQNLRVEPIAGKDSLKYKPRLTIGEMGRALDTRGSDTEKARKMVSILTGEMATVIEKMDSNDWAIANLVTVFYYLA